MSKIIKFAQEREECECPVCRLLEGYTESIINSEDKEDLEYVLTDLIGDAIAIGSEVSFDEGFSNGYREGYKEAIKTDIELKEGFLSEISCDGSCEDFCDKCFDDKEYDC